MKVGRQTTRIVFALQLAQKGAEVHVLTTKNDVSCPILPPRCCHLTKKGPRALSSKRWPADFLSWLLRPEGFPA